MNRVENIMDLPNEIIVLIFEYLQPSDRRVASECCRKFLDIWLRNKFIGDRILMLDDSTFEDPEAMLAFANTQRKYHYLILDFQDETFPEKLALWSHLGKTVTTLDFIMPCNQPNLENFWKMFPKLEILKIYKELPIHMDQLPETLELIYLDEVAGTVLERLSEEYLRKKSGPISIVLKNFDVDSDALRFIIEHRQKITKLKHGDGLVREYESFKNIFLPQLKHLEIDFFNGDANFFENLEEKCPQLQYLDIDLLSHVNLRNWKFLKRLSFSDQSQNEVKQLTLLENLEDLNLFFHQDCFFVHEPFMNKNLKTLTVECDEESICPNCFENMTKSFPNLEKLILHMKIDNGHLRVFQENVPKLKSLSVKTNDDQDIQNPSTLSFEDFPNLSELVVGDGYIIDESNWPLMSHLRRLELALYKENMSIFEKTPALEHLVLDHFGYKEIEELPEMVKNVVDHLKRLRHLILQYDCKIEDSYILQTELTRTAKMHSKYMKRVLISCNQHNESMTNDDSDAYYDDDIAY